MTADADLARRVTRLENETVSIYDLINETSGAIQLTLAEHTARLNSVDQRLDSVEQHLNSVDQHLTEILRRLPAG